MLKLFARNLRQQKEREVTLAGSSTEAAVVRKFKSSSLRAGKRKEAQAATAIFVSPPDSAQADNVQRASEKASVRPIPAVKKKTPATSSTDKPVLVGPKMRSVNQFREPRFQRRLGFLNDLMLSDRSYCRLAARAE